MLSGSHTPKQNCLLAALPSSDYERLLPALELLPLPLGFGLYEAGSPLNGVYFPTDSIISLVYVMTNGLPTEVAVTGNDGLVGIPLLMGGETTPNRAVVRSAGHAYRLKVAVLKKELENGGPLTSLLLRYTQSLMTQIAQNAVCIRHHTVEQRLCRWLLMSFDLLQSAKLTTTQAQIACMLGVRREIVTTAACNLQKNGMIHYSRGHIAVLDRSKLEARVCECYAALKRETDRLTRKNLPRSSPAIRRPPLPHNPASHMYLNAQTANAQRRIIPGK